MLGASASVLSLSAAMAVGVIGPSVAVPAAGAAPAVLYSATAAKGTGDCSTRANACRLATALADVAPGGTIDLVTPGTAGHYLGNWTVGTAGTTASAPVTIQAAPRLAGQPVLDGNKGASTGCTTTSCAGPVLTVPATESVALAGITIADANNPHGYGGGLANQGTVTITGTTFTGNRAWAGGAIETGAGQGSGASVTVTASTFANNSAKREGGAIDSSAGGGGGTVTVTASTFAGNHAGSRIYGGFGGAIDNADGQLLGLAGGGTVTVTASTFAGNSAGTGAVIDNGDEHLSSYGTVQVAGDVFDDSCNHPMGTWIDGGYNAGRDGSCFNAGPGDVNAGSTSALNLVQLAPNGGPTQTVLPGPGSPAIGIIPDPASITLGGGSVSLCPTSDQRGLTTRVYACDAGAVQTKGIPALLVFTAFSPTSFSAAGQVITYTYQVDNISPATLTGVSVTDPAVPGISCPGPSIPPNSYEQCTGTYTTTAADVAAGTITDTATATATINGVPVTSTDTVKVHAG
jgi:uncharacterized repeat protein (TIGR01451 family)